MQQCKSNEIALVSKLGPIIRHGTGDCGISGHDLGIGVVVVATGGGVVVVDTGVVVGTFWKCWGCGWLWVRVRGFCCCVYWGLSFICKRSMWTLFVDPSS